MQQRETNDAELLISKLIRQTACKLVDKTAMSKLEIRERVRVENMKLAV
jgi:hypothetical protein